MTAFQNEWKFLVLVGGGTALLLLPQFLPYVDSARMFGRRPYSAVRETFPRILSFFHVGTESVFEGWVSKLLGAVSLPAAHEQKMGVGIFTSILIFFGFYRGRKSLSLKTAGILSLLLIGISISFFNASLWGLIYLFFPGGGAIRVASRIIFTLLFLYSIGLASSVDRFSPNWRWLMVLLIILEQSYSIPSHLIQPVEARVKAISASIPSPCQVFYAMGGKPDLRDDEVQMDMVYSAHESGRSTLNGYFGHDPIGWRLSPGSEEFLKAWEDSRGFKLTRSCVIHL